MIVLLIFVIWSYNKLQTHDVGDTVENNGIAVTVNSCRWNKEHKNLNHEKGYKWLVIDVTIENKSEEIYYIWPNAFDLNYMYGEVLTKEWLSEGLNPDSKTRGKIAFKIRDTRKELRFAYNFSARERAVFIINNVE